MVRGGRGGGEVGYNAITMAIVELLIFWRQLLLCETVEYKMSNAICSSITFVIIRFSFTKAPIVDR